MVQGSNGGFRQCRKPPGRRTKCEWIMLEGERAKIQKALLLRKLQRKKRMECKMSRSRRAADAGPWKGDQERGSPSFDQSPRWVTEPQTFRRKEVHSFHPRPCENEERVQYNHLLTFHVLLEPGANIPFWTETVNLFLPWPVVLIPDELVSIFYPSSMICLSCLLIFCAENIFLLRK